MLRSHLIVRLGVASFFVLSACSHKLPVKEYPETASPREEVNSLDADLQIAKDKQVDAFSPNHFQEAFEHLDSAKQGLRRQKESKKVLHEVAEGRAHLNRANEVTKTAHMQMESVAVARQQAIKAGASEYFHDEFKRVDNDLKDVGSDLEKGNTTSASKNSAALQVAYLDLEVKAIKENRLGFARKTIWQAKNEGAKKYAPRTLAIAEKSVEDTDAYITANPHDTDQLDKRSQEAREKADHALKITRAAKSDTRTASEDLALAMEREQERLQSKEEQLLQKDSELSQEKMSAQRLSEEKQRMEEEKAFNRKYEEARALFAANEAEVFQQGHTLIIRLKSIEFPVAKATLKGSNFPVLAKVEKVLENFDTSSVVVEGHTDSVGSKKTNEKLSKQRAEAVKEYLVSNAEENLDDIEAVGMADNRPIASNKTTMGRAQNRRVDIVIRPEFAQQAQESDSDETD